MVLSVVSSQDGPRITVNDLLRDPLLIPSFVLDMAQEEFIADAVLRSAGPIASGVARFYESTPIYADDDASTRNEFAEVPIAATTIGEPRVAYVEERALGVVVSDEMRRRHDIDPVTRQLVQVRNTLTRSWDNTFMKAILNNPSVNRYTAPTPWSDNAAKIRVDLAESERLIENATTASGGGYDTAFGFVPDTLIINRETKADLLAHDEFNKIYQGNIADQSLAYRGVMPNQIFGLDVMISRRVDPGKAILMQRGIAGFIADELPLQASPLYRDEPRKMWRSDIQRASAIGIDQPKALCIINGLSV